MPALVLSQAVTRPSGSMQRTSARPSPLWSSISTSLVESGTVGDLLNIGQSHATVKDGHTPALGTRRRPGHNTDILKRQLVGRSIPPVLPERQRARGLVLDQQVTPSIAIPVRQVDAHPRARHVQRDAGALPPVGRLVDVGVDLGGVAVGPDPDVLIISDQPSASIALAYIDYKTIALLLC